MAGTRAGPYRPAEVYALPTDGVRGVHVCVAAPPRRAGPVRLAGWWPSVGSGPTRRAAARAAAAEAVERACAVFQGTEPTVTATYRSLGDDAVHPDRLTLCSARQRREGSPRPRSALTRVPPSFDADARIAWTAVRSLTRDAPVFLPAMYVYLRYPARGRRRWCAAGSNGLAAGRTRADATLRALLELVERDSVALWWYNRARRPGVDLGGRARSVFPGRETWALDLTSDLGVPVVAAVSRRPGRGGDDLAFGFGAALTLRRAARHALGEVAQMLAVRRAGGRGGAGTAAFERWRRQARTARHPHLVPHDAVARTPVGKFTASTPRTALAGCRAALEAHGFDVLVADLSRTGAPLRVCRVVVPGLRHIWPRFAPGRLYDAPVEAGWHRARLSESRLNPVPLLV